MSIEIIQQRLLEYNCKTILEQENALKEIAQEIALMALSNTGFFKIAAFQGGTCLRILYGLNRFSEDLDFVLNTPDHKFDFEAYISTMQADFSGYGYVLEVTNKQNLSKAVRMAFLKAESTGGILVLKDARTNRPKLQIKLEIDTNPPAGSNYEIKYLDFPIPYSIMAQDLPSLFAGKCHALICRNYAKGRDWYDFIWYVARKTQINFELLQNAIDQKGPWQTERNIVNKKWFVEQIRSKIDTVDWEAAKADVARFLGPKELKGLDLWAGAFFHACVERLGKYLV